MGKPIPVIVIIVVATMAVLFFSAAIALTIILDHP
jgi:hypothetical protein